jgi:serine/threonine protein kinase
MPEAPKWCPRCFGPIPADGVCPNLSCLAEDVRPANALPLGAVVGDRLVVGRVLGQGGFGITYVAWDQRQNRRVALKECFPAALAQRDGTSVIIRTGESQTQFARIRQLFIEEATLLKPLAGRTNGIVAPTDVLEANGTAYSSMELLSGMTLREYLEDRGGRIPYDTARRLFAPIFDALSVLHSARILHRDISPENIFLTSAGVAKLIDFGAARQTVRSGGTRPKTSPILKLMYAPPEQYSSKTAQGPWTDLFSLAATFYHSLTGEPPPIAMDRLAANEKLIPPSTLGLNVPSSADQPLLKALAIRPEDRYQSVSDFIAELPTASPGDESRISVPSTPTTSVRHASLTVMRDAPAPNDFSTGAPVISTAFFGSHEQRYKEISDSLRFYRDGLQRDYEELSKQARHTYRLWLASVGIGIAVLLVGVGLMFSGRLSEGVLSSASTIIMYFVQRVFQQREDHYRVAATQKHANLEYGNQWLLIIQSIDAMEDPYDRAARQGRLVDALTEKLNPGRGPSQRGRKSSSQPHSLPLH